MIKKTVHIIRHVAFEDLGSIEPILGEAGYTINYFEAGFDDLRQLSTKPATILIVLGGPIGVNQVQDYPFISDELAILRERIKYNLPTLGICLGSQLLATAFGAKVVSNPQPEIGWSTLDIFTSKEHPYFEHLIDVPVLHWHQDTFTLPENAYLHASTPICTHQAFSVGDNFVGLQFHPEVTERGMERWFIGNSHEIAAANNLTLYELRNATRLHAGNLSAAAGKFFRGWLESVFIQ